MMYQQTRLTSIILFLSIPSLVLSATYPLHIDILADELDEVAIYNASETLVQCLKNSLKDTGVYPITFAISTENEVPGIPNLTKKSTNSSFYIDVRKKPSSVLCNLSKYLNVTYIRTSAELTNKCLPIRIRPSVTEYVEAAQQIFEYGGRLYTDVVLLDHFSHDIDLRIFMRGNDTLIGLMKFTLDGGPLKPLLTTFIEDGNTQLFIVLASRDVLSKTMQQISKLTIIRMDHWIVIPTDSFDCPSPNTTFFFVCLHHRGDDFNATCTDLTTKFDNGFIANSFDVISTAVASFVPASLPSTLTNREKLSRHIYAAFPTAVRDDLAMTIDKVIVDNDRNVSVQYYGNWTREFGIKMIGQPFDPIPASLMTVVVIHEPPFVERFTNDSGTFFRGYSIDVLDRVAAEMGFTYIAREVRDGQYGVLLPNGSWTGIIGEVSQGFADLGVGPISVTTEREAVIDFTAPYYDYAGLQILMNNEITPTSMFGFVEAFEGVVWLIWLCFLVATATLLFVFHLLTYKVFATKTKEEKLFNISDAMWFVIASVTLQGPDRYQISFSSRILVLGFWFFCQIMLATYTANMAAFMTSRRLSFDIESLADLNDQSTIAYSALSGSVSETYFRRMTAIEDKFFAVWRNMSYTSHDDKDLSVWDYPLNDLYTKIFKEINKTGFIGTSAEGVRRVLDGRFAFIHETPMIKYEQTKQCNLVAVGEAFSSKPYALVLPENSPLKKEFNSKILGLQSGTFLNDLKEKWWPDTLRCETIDDSVAGLPLSNLMGVIIMTSVGCVLGLVILTVEIFVHRKYQQKKETTECKDMDKINLKSTGSVFQEGQKKKAPGGGIVTVFDDM